MAVSTIFHVVLTCCLVTHLPVHLKNPKTNFCYLICKCSRLLVSQSSMCYGSAGVRRIMRFLLMHFVNIIFYISGFIFVSLQMDMRSSSCFLKSKKTSILSRSGASPQRLRGVPGDGCGFCDLKSSTASSSGAFPTSKRGDLFSYLVAFVVTGEVIPIFVVLISSAHSLQARTRWCEPSANDSGCTPQQELQKILPQIRQ